MPPRLDGERPSEPPPFVTSPTVFLTVETGVEAPGEDDVGDEEGDEVVLGVEVEGTVTFGVFATGVVTEGTVAFGVVTVGVVVVFGVVTLGVVTLGVVPVGTLTPASGPFVPGTWTLTPVVPPGRLSAGAVAATGTSMPAVAKPKIAAIRAPCIPQTGFLACAKAKPHHRLGDAGRDGLAVVKPMLRAGERSAPASPTSHRATGRR
jgi:hypothetical protein